MKIAMQNNVNQIIMSSSLLKLAAKESDDNKNELSIYCKFLSEKIILMSTSFNERVHPENHCKMACGLQLRNNNTNRNETTRKIILFILLPVKRTLLDVSSKSAIPLEFFE